MKLTSSLAVALGLVAVTALSVPAAASKKDEASDTAKKSTHKDKFSPAGGKAIAAMQKADSANDDAAFQAASASADAAASTPDDRYWIAQYRINHAIKAKDNAAILAGLNAQAASGSDLAQENATTLYTNIANLSADAKNYDAAAAAYEKLIALDPAKTEYKLGLAETRASQKRLPEAAKLIGDSIDATHAAGQPVPENWYRRAINLSLEGNNTQETSKLTSEWLKDYPTDKNWSDSLKIYQQSAQLDKVGDLDLFRLMRATRTLKSEKDYFEFADSLNTAGLPGEAKAVLQEGIAAHAIDPNKPVFKELITLSDKRVVEDRASLPSVEQKARSAGTGGPALTAGDVYYGYGDYAKAADLYKVAIAKGSVDANVANSHLGMALAQSGQKAEAMTAFKSVTGPHAQIAAFWLLWLSKPA